MSLLSNFLEKNGICLEGIEGFSQQLEDQPKLLSKFATDPSIKKAMEIGFNAGHSAELFLSANPTLHLTSFDLGEHIYVDIAKRYIDEKFPGRHTLIKGNSMITIPEFKKQNPDTIFDLIFIDGGHEYVYAMSDLKNCKKLANSQTILLMDDIQFTPTYMRFWNEGCTKAWLDAVEMGEVYYKGFESFCEGRGMSWGYYLF